MPAGKRKIKRYNKTKSKIDTTKGQMGRKLKYGGEKKDKIDTTKGQMGRKKKYKK